MTVTSCAAPVVDLESLPSMPFLNIVKARHDNKAWDWLPWTMEEGVERKGGFCA